MMLPTPSQEKDRRSIGMVEEEMTGTQRKRTSCITSYIFATAVIRDKVDRELQSPASQQGWPVFRQ